MSSGEVFIFKGEKPEDILETLKTVLPQVPESGSLAALAAKAGRSKSGRFVLAIPAEDGAKLKEKMDLVLKSGAGAWEAPPSSFSRKGICVGSPDLKPKLGFLFPGQGSQYVDMLRDLRDRFPVVRETFAEADEALAGLMDGRLSDLIFSKGGETAEQLEAMQGRLTQTEVTQPAMLTADVALYRLLQRHGVEPDSACGHSLGEYGALVAAGVLDFKDAVRAVRVRAQEMAKVQAGDNGKMASISAPVDKVEPILKSVDGYVEAVNKNAPNQTVVAGASAAVEEAVRRFAAAGIKAQLIAVSHAFHSRIVAPATKGFGEFVAKLPVRAPRIPVLSNVSADRYPSDDAGIRRLMVSQIESPVEFIREVERMYQDGVRCFVEVGPKRALSSFASAILEGKPDVLVSNSNHPKRSALLEFNDLLARLAAAGFQISFPEEPSAFRAQAASAPASDWGFYTGPVLVSGIAAGVPGSHNRVFREDALDCIIAGENLIDVLPEEELAKQREKNLQRTQSPEDGGDSGPDAVIRLAGRAGAFDMAQEFGVRGSVSSLMDVTAKLGLAAGILALKDAGIPLVRSTRKHPKTGRMVPGPWALPEEVGARTGVVLATSFPGLDSLIDDVSRYYAYKFAAKPAQEFQELFERSLLLVHDENDKKELTDWYESFRSRHKVFSSQLQAYEFSRSFLMRVLTMGHGQTAQFLHARGPCTQVNAACASTTQAVGIAEDWIRMGRADRVLVVAAEDPTSPKLMEWLGTGFLATGAASTKALVSEAALPFDRRRNGMIMGMGAAALVLETADEAARRGITPRAELLASQFENSAFHATRLDVEHVGQVMEDLIRKVERRHGLSRRDMAPKTVFMSHETFTPAQGGCSAGEVSALKRVFGEDVSKLVIANTKGFTGHAMATALEDVVGIHCMNVGKLPPIANYREPDPDLSGIQLSRGGEYDCEYALRLGAGFGSQVALTFMKRVWRSAEPRIQDQKRYTEWLGRVSGQARPQLEVIHNTLRIKEPQAEAAPSKPEPVKAAAPEPEPPPQAIVVPESGWVLQSVQETASGPAPALQGQTVVILSPDPESAKPFVGVLKNAGAEEPVVLKGSWRTREEAARALRSALTGKKARGLLDLSSLALEDFESLTTAGLEKSWRSSVSPLRWAVETLRKEPDPFWLLLVTRMGGLHGTGSMSCSPIGTALTGLVRHFRREGLRALSVDFEAGASLDEMARSAVSQLATPGSPDAGFSGGKRHALGVAKQAFPPEPKRALSHRSTALLAGIRGPVAAAIGKLLAKRLKCSVVAIDSVELRKEAASWARMSPEELSETEKTHAEVRDVVGLEHDIEEMCRSGSKVVYVQACLTEAASAAKAVKTALRSARTIDLVVLGCAGGETDAVRSAFHLLRNVPPSRRQAWVFLSEEGDDAGARGFLTGLARRMAAAGRPAMSLALGPGDVEELAEKVLAQAEFNAGDAEVLLFEPAPRKEPVPEKTAVAA